MHAVALIFNLVASLSVPIWNCEGCGADSQTFDGESGLVDVKRLPEAEVVEEVRTELCDGFDSQSRLLVDAKGGAVKYVVDVLERNLHVERESEHFASTVLGFMNNHQEELTCGVETFAATLSHDSYSFDEVIIDFFLWELSRKHRSNIYDLNTVFIEDGTPKTLIDYIEAKYMRSATGEPIEWAAKHIKRLQMKPINAKRFSELPEDVQSRYKTKN